MCTLGIQATNLGMTSQQACNIHVNMIPRKLKAAGYRTAQIGKYACGSNSKNN